MLNNGLYDTTKFKSKKYTTYKIGTKILCGELPDIFVTSNFKLILWLFHMTTKRKHSLKEIKYMDYLSFLPNDIISYIIKFLAVKTGEKRHESIKKDNLIYCLKINYILVLSYFWSLFFLLEDNISKHPPSLV